MSKSRGGESAEVPGLDVFIDLCEDEEGHGGKTPSQESWECVEREDRKEGESGQKGSLRLRPVWTVVVTSPYYVHCGFSLQNARKEFTGARQEYL